MSEVNTQQHNVPSDIHKNDIHNVDIHNVEWSVARLLAHRSASPLGTDSVALSSAIGRVLADDLVALQDLPPAHTSMMDGYAVAGESPWTIVGSVRAGEFRIDLDSGTAVKVNTGAHIPATTRFVIPDEVALVEDNVLRCATELPEGKHVRLPGDEARASELIAAKGTVVNPAVAGLAASSGVDTLTVFVRPTVDVVVTGDELISQGIAGPGHIRDSLSVQVPAWVEGLGAVAGAPRRCVDTLADTVQTLSECAAHIIVTTGGTAHGEFDFIRSAVAELNGTFIVDEIHMRPGHPCFIAQIPTGQIIVSVPGNPLAALVSFMTLVDPLVRGFTGRTLPELDTAQLDRHESVDRTRITPVHVHGGVAHTTEYRGSAMLRGLVNATHLAVIPAGTNQPGTLLQLLQLPW